MKCPNCGCNVEKTNFCPYCGCDLKKCGHSILPSPRKNNTVSDQAKELTKSFGKFILAKTASSIKDYSEKIHAQNKIFLKCSSRFAESFMVWRRS